MVRHQATGPDRHPDAGRFREQVEIEFDMAVFEEHIFASGAAVA